jgi:hypothetical protein
MTFTDIEIKDFFQGISNPNNFVELDSIGDYKVVKSISKSRMDSEYIVRNDIGQYFHVTEVFAGCDVDDSYITDISTYPIDKKYISLF